MADKQVAPLLEQLQKDPKKKTRNFCSGRSSEAHISPGTSFRARGRCLQRSVEVEPAAETLNELAFVPVLHGRHRCSHCDLKRRPEAAQIPRTQSFFSIWAVLGMARQVGSQSGD